MPLDTRIALTGQPLQLESPLAQYSQLMSVVNAGTQNQLAQMQMSAAQRAMQEEEGAQNYLADPANDLTTAKGQRGLLRFGAKGQTILKSLAEQRKLQTEEDKSKYEFEVKTLDRAIGQILNLTDLPMAFADIDRQIAAKSITPQQGAELKTRINNAPDFSTWQNQTLTGMLDAKERLGAMADQQYQAFRAKPAPAAVAPAAAPLPQAMATAPINDTRAALMPVPTERSVNAIQLGDGNVVYRVDGKDVPFAVYADAVRGRNQAQGANAAIAAAPAPMAPASAAAAAAAAPMAPAAAAPTPPASAPAQPDMANALALKIQGLQDERNKLVPFLRSSSAKTQYEDLGKQIDNLSKGFSISAGGAYFLPNVGMVERPAAAPAPSDLARLMSERAALVASGVALTDNRVVAYDNAIQKVSSPSAGQPSDVTRLITERNAAVARKAPPDEIAALNAAIKKATTPAQGSTVNVNAYAPASVEAQKQFVQTATDERKALRNAPDTIKNIEAAKKLIPSASTFMGTGGEPLLAAASFLNNRLGFGISTQGVTDATVLRTRLFEGILDNLKKLDSQPSQEQQRVLAEALGNLGTDPAALEQILDRIGETVRDRVDRFNTDVTEAETRGVKFPFKPQIGMPARKLKPEDAAAQIPTGKAAAAGGNVVTLPDGRTKTFPTAEAAAQFKKAAGL